MAGSQNAEISCPFCLNTIFKGAKKCHYCQEWLVPEGLVPEVEAIHQKRDDKIFKSDDPVSFQAKLANRFSSVNYWLFYLAISTLLFSLIALYWTFSNEDRIFLVSFFMYAIQMFFSSAGGVWFEQTMGRLKLELPGITGWSQQQCEEYFQNGRKHIFKQSHSFILAAILCTTAVLGDRYLLSSPFKSGTSENVFLVYEALYLFWTAILIASFFKFALFVRDLGEHDLNILLIQEENAGIRLVGKILLKTALFIVIPYFLGIFARQIGGWNFSIPLIIWFGALGAGILFYIFYPMYNIHKAMIREKDRKLSLVAIELNKLLAGETIERRNIHNIKNLIEIRAHLQDINTWPFDMNKVAGILSALAIPMVSVLIDRLVKG